MSEVFDVIDEDSAKQAIQQLLTAFKIDAEKHTDIERTPERVVNMLKEMWQGELYTNDEIANLFNKTFDADSTDMVVMTNIPCFSFCEHHLALIYNLRISVGYLPQGKVIGLSKIARIADMVCRRLQLQERICTDIAEIMAKIVGDDVIVYVEGEHSCMTARGIQKQGTVTKSLFCSGRFSDESVQRKFFEMLR